MDTIHLVSFAVIMLSAALFDDSQCCRPSPKPDEQLHWLLISSQDFAVGILTGFIGVGGGFLIIPALVLLGQVPKRS